MDALVLSCGDYSAVHRRIRARGGIPHCDILAM
jgi:hypothetical protein